MLKDKSDDVFLYVAGFRADFVIEVTTDDLNVRTEANATSKILGTVDTGGKLSVYAIEGKWLKILLKRRISLKIKLKNIGRKSIYIN